MVIHVLTVASLKKPSCLKLSLFPYFIHIKLFYSQSVYSNFPFFTTSILFYYSQTSRKRPPKMASLGRLKTKENFKLLALKVVVVAYERCQSLTRGSQFRYLPEKLLVFWKTGRLREVVATRGSTVVYLCKENNSYMWLIILTHCTWNKKQKFHLI